MYTMYTNVSNNTPSYTHISLYVVRKIPSPPPPKGDAATNGQGDFWA